MNKTKRQLNLRNEDVGQAYMAMLDVLEAGRRRGLTDNEIIHQIDLANPWGGGQVWRCRAWEVAKREFCKDHGLGFDGCTHSKQLGPS
ncbi:hypothetical protein CSC67_07815 [Pusillimonas caeni]|uniref:hypothetical protein n=1 Tax=Pusillimonas caeni TaxID=1348472 RepID=UPI000E59E76E|nr:hypothetical protein [Pusillimonas caeni]TFL14067.1 hypothetical protein CSC67_07815 [Pusillimonas caeni]